MGRYKILFKYGPGFNVFLLSADRYLTERYHLSYFFRRDNMSSIQNPSLAPGVSPRQNALADAQFSSYMRKQSFNARERLDAGLTIKTKEGDLVTLTASSYAELDAFMYNNKGVVQTESGTVAVTQNQRTVTLTSGERFSFSVAGELSEEELADIEAIVKGMDEIISEMARGDMEGAVDKALSMGGYDTVAMYSADLTYQTAYAMTSETRTDTSTTVPAAGALPAKEAAYPSRRYRVFENHPFPTEKNNSIKNAHRFVERMVQQLETHDEKQVAQAQKPVDKLFRHHLGKGMRHPNEQAPAYTAIEDARNQIAKMMENMAGDIFKENLSAFFK